MTDHAVINIIDIFTLALTEYRPDKGRIHFNIFSDYNHFHGTIIKT